MTFPQPSSLASPSEVRHPTLTLPLPCNLLYATFYNWPASLHQTQGQETQDLCLYLGWGIPG